MKRFYVDTALGQWHVTASAPPSETALPLLMLNSRGRSLLPLLPLIGPHYYCLAIDVPGMAGNSFFPQMGVTIPEVGACLGEILDHLETERANFLGVHTGHKIVSAFASEQPDRVERLVIGGKTHSLVPELNARNATMQAYIAKRGPDILVRSLEGNFVDQPEARSGMDAIFEANFNFDLAAAIAKVTAKTLVLEIVSEEEDRDIGRQGEYLAALMPNAKAIAVPQIEKVGLELYIGIRLMSEIALNFLAHNDNSSKVEESGHSLD